MEKGLEKELEKRVGGGKAKIGLVVCAVLVAILAVSNIWFYTALQNQTNLSNDLQFQKDTLQNQLSLLDTAYQNYMFNHTRSDSEYDLLQSEYDTYVTDHSHDNSEYDSLQLEYDNYVANHSYGNSEYDSLQLEYDSYVANHSFTNEEYYDYMFEHLYTNGEYELARFDFYYVVPAEQKFGVYDLEDELYGLYWTEPYQEGVFDCSEMSAYLEFHLENEGWNTIIVIGDSPFGSGYHAWLLVECEEEAYMAVESTTMEIVWWDDPYHDGYWTWDYEFEDIFEALNYDETEFDWWN